MSATIDGARVAKLLGDAPVIESQGRAYPVETRYRGRDPRAPIERAVADAGDRGAAQRRRARCWRFCRAPARSAAPKRSCASASVDPAIDVVALYGALEAEVQDRAIAPAPPGRRKVVLATAIAETSLTIEGVRIVVDCGLARVPRYEPDVGLTRLETVRRLARVGRSAPRPRRPHRARRVLPAVGRAADGVARTRQCRRRFSRPISRASRSISRIGASPIPQRLPFSIRRRAPRSVEAKALLTELGAIDRDGRITEEGQRLRRLPLPPRLARMVVDAGDDAPLAADIALLLTERGLGGNDVDLAHRLDELRRDRSRRAQDARAMAKRWAEVARTNTEGWTARRCSATGALLPRLKRAHARLRRAGGGRVGVGVVPQRKATRLKKAPPLPTSPPFAARMGGEERRGPSRGSEVKDRGELSPGVLLALAYPDRIAKTRGAGGAFLLANGRGANLDPASALSREPFLAVGEIAGTAAQGRILLAAALTLAEIEAHFGDRIEQRDEVTFDEASASLRGRHDAPPRRTRARRAADAEFEPDDDTARLSGRGHRAHRHRQAALDEIAAAMARPRDVPAPGRRRRMAGSVRRGAVRRP